MKKYIILWVYLLLATQVCHAQNFKLMRFDEDYSFLKDSSKTFYNRIKFLPLNAKASNYLSFGGSVRQELDRAQNEDWGAFKAGTDVFLLQRYNVHADLHLGTRLRFFGQFRSGLEFGRLNGPRPIDEDKLNVQNLFVDITPYRRQDRSLTLRLGRQEIQYGSGRLLDVRDGPNLRQYFDGFRIAFASPGFHIDGFALANGGIKTGVFDNPLHQNAKLWGIYTTALCSVINFENTASKFSF
ncbi:MAG: alginate export family protein [Flavitalea sp.]